MRKPGSEGAMITAAVAPGPAEETSLTTEGRADARACPTQTNQMPNHIPVPDGFSNMKVHGRRVQVQLAARRAALQRGLSSGQCKPPNLGQRRDAPIEDG